MNHWNYRVVVVEHEGETLYEVHEVYYDDEGKPIARTAEATGFAEETVLDLIQSLQRAIEAAQNKPVLTDADFGVDSTP